MTSTIDLANEACMEPRLNGNYWIGCTRDLETFRALCVAEALAQERSKPVATVKQGYDAAPSIEWLCNPADLIGKSLYAGEQERSKREPLTADELWLIWNSQGDDYMSRQEVVAFARAVEKRHGIGEQG